jgi:hypothetical protein
MAKRVRQPDLNDNVIGPGQVIDKSLTIDDLKTETDLDAVTSETIPYERTNPAISIHDVVDPLTANTFNLVGEVFTATGLSDTFTLSGTVDTTAIYYAIVNGQFQNSAVDFSLITGDTEVQFAYIPENGLNIRIYYKPV